MKVKDYLSKFNEYKSVTFIKARARKDRNTPYYHAEYQTTPLRTIDEWRKSDIMNYIILNDRQPSIDWLSGASWKNQMCMLVVSEEDLALLYPSADQRKSMERFIEGHLDFNYNLNR